MKIFQRMPNVHIWTMSLREQHKRTWCSNTLNQVVYSEQLAPLLSLLIKNSFTQFKKKEDINGTGSTCNWKWLCGLFRQQQWRWTKQACVKFNERCSILSHTSMYFVEYKPSSTSMFGKKTGKKWIKHNTTQHSSTQLKAMNSNTMNKNCATQFPTNAESMKRSTMNRIYSFLSLLHGSFVSGSAANTPQHITHRTFRTIILISGCNSHFLHPLFHNQFTQILYSICLRPGNLRLQCNCHFNQLEGGNIWFQCFHWFFDPNICFFNNVSLLKVNVICMESFHKIIHINVKFITNDIVQNEMTHLYEGIPHKRNVSIYCGICFDDSLNLCTFLNRTII